MLHKDFRFLLIIIAEESSKQIQNI